MNPLNINQNSLLQETCKGSLLELQQRDKNEGWIDIRYNFIVAKDGLIFAGRNWDISGQIGDPKYDDTNLINIGFMGNFDEIEPDQISLKKVKTLLNQGLNFEKLNTTFIVYAESDLNEYITSPGKKLFEKLKDFPHFRSTSNRTMNSF